MTSRANRQARILEVVRAREVSSQSELAQLLADDGITVSQGTLSKDLLEIGAVRIRGSKGNLVYAAPGAELAADAGALEARLTRLCQEVLLGADASANLVVLRTPPGAAQYFASAIDQVRWHEILGTIAGDDTVLLIARDPAGGEQVATRFMAMGGEQPPTTPPTTQETT